MSKRPRRNHAPAFNAKVALEAMKGDQTLVELSERYQVQSTLFNMKFRHSVFEKPEGMRAFWALIKTYSYLGGYLNSST